MSSNIKKEKKWFKPMFEFDDDTPVKKTKRDIKKRETANPVVEKVQTADFSERGGVVIKDHKTWIKSFEPLNVEDLAVNNKKIQEVDEWMKSVCNNNNGDMLLLTGPVGCGKTITIQVLAAKYHMKVTEWITPLDIDFPSENGEFEFKQRQSSMFLDFILKAANFTSLIDNNSKKIVLVEDFPNTFLRTPSEFTEVLHQYRQRAKSPIVFICSESHTDGKNTAANLFTPSLKEQFSVQHITFNSVAPTNLRSALKRVASIISKKHAAVYNNPTADAIECVVNSSVGDVRSAVLNLHFSCLKVIDSGNGKQKLTHSPEDIIEQFISQPTSFVNFLEENYLPHFSCIDHVDKATSALSDADFMLAEWREKMCQEHGLYTAVAGLMLANKAPVSAWNPVRGPKNMKVQYPSVREIPLLEENNLYKGKILVADYLTYCKIIASKIDKTIHE
ncbi:rad17 checkpoint clamp loader component isoform X2 [Anticarsia gemmatalis]|uniref:rad17 checkpoint clamp loader component isoform X2 n=1 Tax=Anticarsia gemmatalis TaxID=129554 RepID=UPI003F764C6A